MSKVKSLHKALSIALLENKCSQPEVLAFLVATLVGTCEMYGDNEIQFDLMCERMKKEFRKKRKARNSE